MTHPLNGPLVGSMSGATSGAITVVVPTFNEAGNVALLVRRLAAVAAEAGIEEVIFVDDSTDDTPEVIAEVAHISLVPVRLIHRSGSARVGGLSGAVVEGIGAAESPWVLVMDGDLQHPPEDVPRLARARSGADLVVASRYCDGGAADGLSDGRRRLVSKVATWLAGAMFPRRLRGCTDTMTGFFAVRRDAVDLSTLRPSGFKILLEILGRQRLRVVEVPFRFARRHSGTSKAELSQGVQLLTQLGRLRLASWRHSLARRLGAFALVGLLCLVVDVAIFNLLLPSGKPLTAKLVAAAVSVGVSYVLNARWTWPGRRTTSRSRQVVAFAAVSGVGVALAEACLLVSHYLLDLTSTWADNVSANVVGLALGMAWRFLAYDRWVFPAVPAVASTGADVVDVAHRASPPQAAPHPLEVPEAS